MNTIETLIREERVIAPPTALREGALIRNYDSLYLHSISSPDWFWGGVASELQWAKKWHNVLEFTPPHHKWFLGGKTNITINALDRHVQSDKRNKAALIWTTEDGSENILTYDRLLRRVCHTVSI